MADEAGGVRLRRSLMRPYVYCTNVRDRSDGMGHANGVNINVCLSMISTCASVQCVGAVAAGDTNAVSARAQVPASGLGYMFNRACSSVWCVTLGLHASVRVIWKPLHQNGLFLSR